MNHRQDRFFRYHGLSMWPCFQEGDLLEIEPVKMMEIRVGDCLVFWQDNSQQIVHRVFSNRINLETRGDAFKQADEQPVPPDRIVGRAIYRYRMGRKTTVANGLIGIFASRFFYFAGRIDPQRPSRGGRVARWIQSISIFWLKPLWRRGKAQTLQRINEQPVIIWKLGSLVIGWQNPHNREWLVSWPWSILLNLPLATERKKEEISDRCPKNKQL